jgi:hypothetical protein
MKWSCGELESIPHILKGCVLREHMRDILRKGEFCVSVNVDVSGHELK